MQELIQKITEANENYRTGESIISDQEYDILVEQLEAIDPTHKLLDNVGFISDDDERKEKLPIIMASMNKVKLVEEIAKWIRLKEIPIDTEYVLTPKYDGISQCVEELPKNAFTRGDGEYGQRSDGHFAMMDTNHLNFDIKTFGEVIMPRQVFLDNYSEDFKNPRNMVGGKMNDDEPNEALKHCSYIRYGMVDDDMPNKYGTKAGVLDFLNEHQKHKVPYKIVKSEELTEDYLKDLFMEWCVEYEIDGIIIEVNDLHLCESLGRETSSNNPTFARAYKGAFEQVKESTVLGISWNISKQGYLKPIIHIEPLELDGVTVSNVTGNNARYMKEMGIGIGSKVKVKRSGFVIPLIVEVTEEVEFQLPDVGVEIGWNENAVELVTLEVTPQQRLQQLISFFKILDVENASEGVITQLFENGYETVKQILNLTKADLEELDRFGKRKAEIVYDSIQSKMSNVALSKLQHATGLFNMLGSKKLLLLEHFETKPSVVQIVRIDGFSDKSANAYLNSIDEFNEFLADLDGLITVKKTEIKTADSNELEGMVFVFTGVRRADLNEIIENRGGKIASGVSAKITHLVMKSKGSGSSKEKKALDLGKTILTVEELEELLGV